MLSALPALAQTPATPAMVAPGPVQTCLKCHGTEANVVPILQTPHAVKGDPHSPFGQEGCESCHGQSDAHLQSRKNPPAVVFKGPASSPVAVRNEQCLSCHQAGLRMNWQGSAHETNDKACTDCHTIHVRKDPVLVKITQPEVCFTCHARQRADSFKYSHHPIREGKVVCSDCHNAHGAAGDTKLLKEFTTNETCYTCHAEKRGPLLWEHQPVRDNCLNCHTPHGSNQPRLMTERMNFLCSSCHSAASNNSGGAFGGAHSIPFRGPGTTNFNSALANQRQCLNCHSQVHGSNSPSGAFFFR
jgi:DmsE family decaheme c-type cytochrome